MPLNPEEVEEAMGSGGGQFISPTKLLEAGKELELAVLDMSRYYGTEDRPVKYPCEGKKYCQRIRMEWEGKTLLMDVNGKDLCHQFSTVLWPNGSKQPMVPCRVRVRKRESRSKYQANLELTRLGPLTPVATDPSEQVSF